GDDVADAVRPVALKLLGDVGLGGSDARDVRRGLVSRGADVEHGLERAFARRAAGAIGAREEARLEPGELVPRGAQLLLSLRRLRREELEAVCLIGHAGRAS